VSDVFLQVSLLFLEATLAGSVLLVLFRLRGVLGLGPIYTTVGVFYYLATLLAGTTFVRISPVLLLSPGSVALFPAALFTVLFIYIRKDAEEARTMIYGMLAANVVASLLGYVVSLHFTSPLLFNPLQVPAEIFTQQPRLFLVGTLTLFIDTILIILVYESISRAIQNLFLRLYLSLALVLVFDTLLFVTGGFVENPAYAEILISGIAGKVTVAVVYAAGLAVYLTHFDVSDRDRTNRRPIRDIFQALTYRQRYEALRTQVTRDPLTGAHSRGYFDDALPAQLAAARRNNAPLVLMVVDVDHFKRINDQYGHAEGDRALRVIAETLAATARASDTVARYGGDEFCLLLPGTSLESASRLAERLRVEVPFACERAAIGGSGENRRVTITIGLALFPVDGDSADTLLRVADRRMYTGKALGRDKTIVT